MIDDSKVINKNFDGIYVMVDTCILIRNFIKNPSEESFNPLLQEADLELLLSDVKDSKDLAFYFIKFIHNPEEGVYVTSDLYDRTLKYVILLLETLCNNELSFKDKYIYTLNYMKDMEFNFKLFLYWLKTLRDVSSSALSGIPSIVFDIINHIKVGCTSPLSKEKTTPSVILPKVITDITFIVKEFVKDPSKDAFSYLQNSNLKLMLSVIEAVSKDPGCITEYIPLVVFSRVINRVIFRLDSVCGYENDFDLIYKQISYFVKSDDFLLFMYWFDYFDDNSVYDKVMPYIIDKVQKALSNSPDVLLPLHITSTTDGINLDDYTSNPPKSRNTKTNIKGKFDVDVHCCQLLPTGTFTCSIIDMVVKNLAESVDCHIINNKVSQESLTDVIGLLRHRGYDIVVKCPDHVPDNSDKVKIEIFAFDDFDDEKGNYKVEEDNVVIVDKEHDVKNIIQTISSRMKRLGINSRFLNRGEPYKQIEFMLSLFEEYHPEVNSTDEDAVLPLVKDKNPKLDTPSTISLRESGLGFN